MTIQVTDSASHTYSKQFSIGMVTSPRGLPWISPMGSLSDVTLGSPQWLTFSAFGGVPPYNWAVTAGSPPAGMRLRQGAARGPNVAPNSAEIMGVPTASGVYSFTLSFTDSSPAPVGPVTVSYPYTLHVSVLDTDQLPNGTRGVAYSGPVRVLGGTAPYAVAYQTGTLQAGLTFNPVTGAFTGTPSENAYDTQYKKYQR